MFSIQDFKHFFVGNYKNNGMQYTRGKWVSGEIPKATFGKCETIKDAIHLHLMQEIAMGSYPYYQKDNEWFCKYLCIDIDSHSNLTIEYSIPADYILREFSGEGFHIWIKLKKAFDFKVHLELQLKKKFTLNFEIFPKQDENIKSRTVVKCHYH